MKKSQVFGIIIAIGLILFGILYPVPEKYMRVSGSSSAFDSKWNENKGAEYIGGDAYNYIIEASLKGGYCAGVLAMKTVSFVGGILLFFIALYSHVKCTCLEEQTRLLSDFAHNQEKNNSA